MFTVQLFSDSQALTAPVSTSYHPFYKIRRWNEWLYLPIRFCELPRNSQLAITIWDSAGPNKYIPYGGTTVRLFDDSDSCLKRGRQKLKVWLDLEADGNEQSTTDSTVQNTLEMDRLETLIKKHATREISHNSWLDNMAFRKIEQINRKQSTDTHNHFLYIDFLQFDYPIVFSDIEYSPPPMYPLQRFGFDIDDNQMARRHAFNNIYSNKNYTSPTNTGNEIYSNYPPTVETGPVVQVIDPDQFNESIVEKKFRRLIRGSEPLGMFHKPTAKIRDQLNSLINASPVHELHDDEKNLLWKFRYYLTRHKQALTKFLKSTSWENSIEITQAISLLPKWAEIDIDDALELLGPYFQHPLVRAHAVDRLRKASDHELELYLLQLVQALRFEKPTSDLSKFLIGRATRNNILGNYFFWYVNVEAQETGAPEIFKTVLEQFKNSLKQNDPEQLKIIEKQVRLINQLLKVAQSVKAMKEVRQKKVEFLKAYLADPRHGLLHFDPIPLPLDPSVIVNGCVPDDCAVFKSSLSPLKLTFKVAQESSQEGQTQDTYSIIFKSGDDLRQDQLVIQIIIVMDQLLRNENIDLKLTPYRILATGPRDGALQFVPNETLANVLSEYNGGILAYLQAHNPDPSTPLGVTAKAMDTYVRSCAGYCVITYLLGVGDRHLDNLLICPDGHFFHADFGYILGHDPKPFPPMMKLPIQIVDGMGGANSENYTKFRSLCFTTFTTLRKSANLILNLFALMSHSTIPDIMSMSGTGTAKVEEKFCLEMSEEEAIVYFQNLINDSVNAFLPMVIDRLHNLAQYWRA